MYLDPARIRSRVRIPTRVRSRLAISVATALVVVIGGTVVALSKSDPGADYQHQLAAQSEAIFGFGHPLDDAASGAFSGPGDQAVETAKGLSVRLVSSSVGQNADMIALWPNDDHPTHAIICNEVNSFDPIVSGSPNPDLGKPTLQRVDLATGNVEDILTGTISCDPVHRTAWGTIEFGEEDGPVGRFYELRDPLHTSGVTINRATGATSDPTRVVVRKALGQLSFEGIVTLPDGTTYYGDELRPSNGKPGGGIYKFVPSSPWSGSAAITSLDQSPLVSGTVHVLRLASSGRSFGDFGQGTNNGEGKWVALATPADPTTFNLATTALAAGGYTGFYRPEDMDLDPIAWAGGRFRACWNNTGNDQAAQWGETVCLEDAATSNTAFPTGHRPVVAPFNLGDPELRMPDNIDFQPGTGIAYLLMDATTSVENAAYSNDSVWACLPDGADHDVLSDGCVRVLNLKDGEAEFTGIQFLGDGRSFLIHLQHRTQDGRAVDGTTDEILVSGLDVH
jgi:Bacterial protein of unknown function (DUF839)